MFSDAASRGGFAERGLAVEVDVAEDAFELLFVGFFNRFEGDVNFLAEVGGVAELVERVEVRAFGQDEGFTAEHSFDALQIARVLALILVAVVEPDIGDVSMTKM